MAYSLCLYQLNIKDSVSCDVYDLADEENKCHILSLPIPRTLPAMHELFQQLMIDYPSTDVKSIVLDMPFINTHFEASEWFHKIRTVGKIYGYANIHRPSTLSKLSTSLLLCARKVGKEYFTNDVVVIMALSGTTVRIQILQKKKLGWDVIKSLDKMFEPGKENVEEYLKMLDLNVDKITDFLINSTGNARLEEAVKEILPAEKVLFLVTGDRTDGEKKDLILETCEYLSKVYSGEDYWKDYDCFVPTVCEKIFELHVGNQVIPFNFQYKPVPCLISKNIRLADDVNRIKVVASYKHNSHCSADSKVIFDVDYNERERNIVFTISVDQCDQLFFRTELNNDSKTFVKESSSFGDQPIFCPAIVIDHESVQVNYFKNGLIWSLKNVHGSKDILTTVCFTEKEPVIGKTSFGKTDELVRYYNFDDLLHDDYIKKNAHDYGRIQLDEDGEYKMVVKTYEGWKKIKPSKLFAIYIEQLLKQLEEKMDEKIEVICLKFINQENRLHESSIMKDAIKKIGIKVFFDT